jgi:dolichol-phosphate mannosyltransferase
MRTISIVTPVYNEQDTLGLLVEQIDAIERGLFTQGFQFEIVLVDDHSTDGTRTIAQALLAKRPRLKYLRLSRNCGSHTALAAGLQACTGQAAVLMAADLQDPPELIPQLIDAWQAGHDVVWAGRSSREGESRLTLLMSGLYYRLMRWLALPEMPKQGADVVLLDRRVIDAYNTISEKHTSLLAMILWMGYRQTSISYVKRARRSGKSKWTLAKKVKLVIDSIVSFSYVPIRLMAVLGFGMAIMGFLYAMVVVLGRLFGWVVAGTGFAALMTVLLVGQGLILCMLGVLGEYLWRTFDEARGRPRYLIEQSAESSAAAPAGASPVVPS